MRAVHPSSGRERHTKASPASVCTNPRLLRSPSARNAASACWTSGSAPGQSLANLGSPAYGTTVQVFAPGHTQVSQLDGGSGSAGKRSFEVNFGLGSYHGPVQASLHWVDNSGRQHQQTITLTPGTHNIMLTSTATEVAS